MTGVASATTVSNWAEFVAHLTAYGHEHLYRGHSRCWDNLKPSLARQLPSASTVIHGRVTGLEGRAIREFAESAYRYLPQSVLPSLRTVEMAALSLQERIEWFVLMQHYGTPTRLLDWTMSPYVAAYFTVENNWNEDGEIWICDSRSLKRRAANALTELLDLAVEREPLKSPNVATDWKNLRSSGVVCGSQTAFEADPIFNVVCKLWQCDLDVLVPNKTQPLARSAVFPITLPILTERMYAQQGWFTVALDPRIDHRDAEKMADASALNGDSSPLFQRFIIPARSKRAFLAELHKANLSGHSLFQGTDGLGRWVGESIRLRFTAEFDPHSMYT